MKSEFSPVDWVLDSNIYEVNLRQYTQEGTLNAFKQHLPRLKEMGVEILWFMPLTPISRKQRKGSLGSYYACSSYTKMNPEYGTNEDFLELVNYAHTLGLKVIIDWVANHTGCDHEWTIAHPEFYKKNEVGEFYDQHGWDDVIDLDYSNQQMRMVMIESMRHWINEFNIDGFRCDMAMLTPVDFWLQARRALQETKDLFWLAELDPLDNPDYMTVFDAAYTWRWMNAATQTKKDGAQQIHHMKYVLSQYLNELPQTACPAWFTSTHDENSWNGTEFEKYGEMALPLAVFSATWKGMPLMYSGQELPNLKRLAFFDKDVIEWKERPELHDFYASLYRLRKSNKAFLSLEANECCLFLGNNVDHHILSFIRKNEDAVVIAVFNFSPYHLPEVEVATQENGNFVEYFTGSERQFNTAHIYIEMPAWSYQVWIKQ
jgi:alpha-amylase